MAVWQPIWKKIIGTYENSFQIGKLGPKIKKSGSLLQFRNSDDNDFCLVQGQNSALKEPYNAIISRVDLNTARIGKKNFSSSIVIVKGEEIDLSSTNYDCTVGGAPDNLIEGGAPAANTQYNLYLQNTVGGGIQLRLSATAPTDLGYRTGDVNNRLVGTAYLDAAKQILSDREIAGYLQEDIFTSRLTANYTLAAGGAGFYDLILFLGLVWLKNTDINITAQIISKYTVNPGSDPDRYVRIEDVLGIGILTQSTSTVEPWGSARKTTFSHCYNKNSAGRGNMKITHYFVGAGTYEAYGDVNIYYSHLTITRKSL